MMILSGEELFPTPVCIHRDRLKSGEDKSGPCTIVSREKQPSFQEELCVRSTIRYNRGSTCRTWPFVSCSTRWNAYGIY